MRHPWGWSTSIILRVTLEDWNGTTNYAEYSQIHLENEQDKYRLRYDQFVGGTTENSLACQKNKQFSTFDNDNDSSSGNCAHDY